MLILIFVNVQYSQNVVVNIGSSDQIHALSDSHHLIKDLPREISCATLTLFAIWKTPDKGPSLSKFISLFQVKFNFSIENVFFFGLVS